MQYRVLTDSAVLFWKLKGRFFDFDGHKVFYLDEGHGEPLLILHGYPYNTFEWHLVWPDLTKKYRAITFDLIGLGFSDKPKNHHYGFEEYGRLVNTFLEFLEIKNVHILSHDLGASVAQELLANDLSNKNSFAIQSVAFVNGGLFTSVYKPRLIQILLSKSPEPIGKLLSKLLTKRTTNLAVKKLFGPNTQPTDKFLDRQWEILNYNNGRSITYLIGKLVFDKENHQSRWITAMQGTTIPICYINGPYDPNSGRHMAEEYMRLIPNPDVSYLSSTIGHWPMLEDPESFLNIYYEFRKRKQRNS